MINKSLLTSVLLLALIQSSISTQILMPYEAADNPFCPAPLILSLQGEDLLQSGQALDFDYGSFVLDPSNGDSIPLAVRKPKNKIGWVWIYSSDNKFSSPKELVCAGTETDTYVKILRDILILKSTSGELKTCVFDPTKTDKTIPSTLAAIPTDQVANKPTVNSAFYIRESPTERSLFFMFSDDSKSAVYSYDLKKASPIAAVLQSKNGALSGKISSGRGNGNFVWDSFNNKIVQIQNWSVVTSMDPLPDGKFSSQNYGINTNVGVLILYNKDRTEVKVAKLTSSSVTDMGYTKSSQSPFKEYSDYSSATLILGADTLLWIYQPFSNNEMLITVILQQFDLDSYNVDMTKIQDITLSGDKAIVYYLDKNDQKKAHLAYLKLKSGNQVKLIYHQQVPPLNEDLENYQYRVTVKCMCQALKRFVCYSSSLSCMIIKKAGQNCLVEDKLEKNSKL